jgi:hypothetical protein
VFIVGEWKRRKEKQAELLWNGWRRNYQQMWSDELLSDLRGAAQNGQAEAGDPPTPSLQSEAVS